MFFSLSMHGWGEQRHGLLTQHSLTVITATYHDLSLAMYYWGLWTPQAKHHPVALDSREGRHLYGWKLVNSHQQPHIGRETLTPLGMNKDLDLRVFFYNVLLNLTNQIYNQIPNNLDGYVIQRIMCILDLEVNCPFQAWTNSICFFCFFFLCLYTVCECNAVQCCKITRSAISLVG